MSKNPLNISTPTAPPAPTRSSRLKSVSRIRNPNTYVLGLENEYAQWAFSELRGPHYRGQWRNLVFKSEIQSPLDVEIGTGNGFFFAHQALFHPERHLVGLEIKFKPLIQTIRRALKNGSTNARVVRFHAFEMAQLFEPEEIDNIYVHFPDPWVEPLRPKRRLINQANLEMLYQLQKPGSFLDFKTDSRDYFLWAQQEIKASPYQVEYETLNLHATDSSYAKENFITYFESLFIQRKVEINFVRLRKK